MSRSKEMDLTTGNPFWSLLKFAIPVILGNLFQLFYTLADSVIVGKTLGADSLAAVGSTSIIIYFVFCFINGFTGGFGICLGQRCGAKDEKGMRKSIAVSTLLSIAFTVVLTLVCCLLAHQILSWMQIPEDISGEAYDYMFVVLLGTGATVFYNMISNMLRALGDSKTPLYFLVFSSVLNIFLDILFIVPLHMGVAGAAWATNLSQAISAVLCAGYIWVKVPSLKPEREHWKIHGSDTRNQLAAGIPMAFQFAITASGTMIMQSAINLFGSVAVAAYTAAAKLQSLVIQGMIAMGQTMATYGGQNYGSGDVKRIKSGVRFALLAEFVYSVAAAALMCALLKPCLGLFFTGDVDLGAMMPWAKTYCYMTAVFFLPLCTIFIFRNIMQGCGYGFLPMMGGVSELIARLLVSMAAIQLLSYPLACFADPAAWIAAALFTGISYLFVIKKIEKELS